MRELHVIVSNKIATYLRRDGNIICGNNDYVIVFSFDSEWDAYEKKTARFKWRGQYQDVEFTGNTVKVPILEDTTLLQVGVFVDDFRTSTPAEIYCQRSARCGDEKDSGIVLKTGSATENGNYKAGDFGADGFSEFKVDVPEKVPNLITKTVTKNGTYPASADGADGFSEFTVNVPESGGTGGGGECSGEHVITVEELPETGEEGATYKLTQAFRDVLVYVSDYNLTMTMSESGICYFYSVPTKPTDNIQTTADLNNGPLHLYYIEDENDIFLYADDGSGALEWQTFAALIGLGTFQGTISDVSEATTDGYYALGGGVSYHQYASGSWSDYIRPSGTLEITTNGEHPVAGKETVNVKTPSTYIVYRLNELPDEIPDGSLIIALGGE